jgi:hypothetical protein
MISFKQAGITHNMQQAVSNASRLCDRLLIAALVKAHRQEAVKMRQEGSESSILNQLAPFENHGQYANNRRKEAETIHL